MDDDHFKEHHTAYKIVGFTKVLFVPLSVIVDREQRARMEGMCEMETFHGGLHSLLVEQVCGDIYAISL